MSRSANILVGDARARLREIPAGSVQCCVTSPPYWGLRDYGTGRWEGGDAGCAHVGSIARTVSGGAGKQYTNAGSNAVYSGDCACGARRVDAQLGLERAPEEYVANMVDVFRDVCRVLRQDGTLWLNLGDSYATGGGAVGCCPGGGEQGERFLRGGMINTQPNRMPIPGLKPKDLVGIPWRVAFALQTDGWWLRSDIVWSKPNPMPESVTDRPTRAHEYLFLLSKSATYFYDADAIAEDAASFGRQHVSGVQSPKTRAYAETGLHGHGGDLGINYERESRNRRTVWTIATQPFPGAHFAVMPEALVEPCVLAGSRHGDLVLDPFAGAGTVGVVALKHGRSFVGVELNPKYAAMARNRIHDDAPLLNRALVSGGEAA